MGNKVIEFKVVLDGIDLTDEQRAQAASAIQKVMLGLLSEVDTGGDHVAVAFPGTGGQPVGLAVAGNGEAPSERLKDIVSREFGG